MSGEALTWGALYLLAASVSAALAFAFITTARARRGASPGLDAALDDFERDSKPYGSSTAELAVVIGLLWPLVIAQFAVAAAKNAWGR